MKFQLVSVDLQTTRNSEEEMRHGSDKSRMGLVVIIAHNPYVAKLPDSDYNLQILS